LAKEKYDIASKLGDIIKIVGKASTIKDNFALYDFVSKVNSRPGAKPIIAINMGVEGQMSRVLNVSFSPVSHPLLPNKAAPGQLSFRQIQQALHLIGLLPAKNFYLFGTPISQSMSPTLHNTAFDNLGLPYKYGLLETEEIGEQVKLAITSPDFGGASVTIPFKLDIIPLLDRLTPAAEAIGAVNTIIPQATSNEGSGGRVLVGDNTDWLGIRSAVKNRLGSTAVRAALVIGAGGTARAAIYALRDLGADVIYLYNRTISKAEKLALAFPEAKIKVVNQIGAWGDSGLVAPNVIVATVPASATTTDDAQAHAVYLSQSLFEYRAGPAVVVDMAYRPAETPLLGLAKAAAGHWMVVPGLEVLLEQGYEQFRLWTGRSCPKSVVATQVWDKYNSVV
jgi:pentafunctional AROM polypeptide